MAADSKNGTLILIQNLTTTVMQFTFTHRETLKYREDLIISTYRYIYIERGSSLTYIYTLLRNFIYRLETYSVFDNRETLYIE